MAKYSQFIKILSVMLSSAALLAFSSCKSDDKKPLDEKNKISISRASENVSKADGSGEISEEASDEASSESSIQRAGIGGKIRSGKLDITLKSLYTTEYIKTGEDKVQSAGDNNIYVVAEFELENMYMSPAEIWCVENMVPSIDGESIDLSHSINAFPRTLNGQDDLIAMRKFTVDTDSKVSGYIAFTAKKDFKNGEIACCTDNKVDGIFEFTNILPDVSSGEQSGEESSEPEKPDVSKEESDEESKEESKESSESGAEPDKDESSDTDENKKTAKELEFVFGSAEVISADEYSLPEEKDGMMYIRCKVTAVNKTNEVYPFTTNDFSVKYGDNKIYPFINSAYTDKLTPGSSHESSIIFCVEKGMDKYILCYDERFSNGVPTKLFVLDI